MSSNSLIKLNCKSMNYAWGKVGKKSLVYQYLEHNGSSLDEKIPYAELWMGDHSSAPSLTADGKRISEITEELPFLFKILSVEEPLSLQCHPDLKNAAILHAKDPKNYPDPNHKPECGLFLTRTSLLYGVREYTEIVHYIQTIPEFRDLVSKEASEKFQKNSNEETFKIMLNEILSLRYEAFAPKLEGFKQNYKKYGLDEKTLHGIELIINHFPKDIGVFIPLILNVVVGEPGHALLIPTGTLHAYLEGDLIEAMALSDNVIRAAMTPKFVDVESLFKVMNFKPQKPHYLHAKNEQNGIQYFDTGFDSFNLESGKVENGKSVCISKKKHASIFSILKGKVSLNGEVFKEGNTLLVMPNTEVNVKAIDGISNFYICSSK